MVKFGPVPKALPPVKLPYQEIVPAEADALRFTVPAPVLEPGVVPVIVGAGATVVVNVRAVPEPQLVDGVTLIFPELAPTVTVTELVVPPAVCDQPAGNAQV